MSRARCAPVNAAYNRATAAPARAPSNTPTIRFAMRLSEGAAMRLQAGEANSSRSARVSSFIGNAGEEGSHIQLEWNGRVFRQPHHSIVDEGRSSGTRAPDLECFCVTVHNPVSRNTVSLKESALRDPIVSP